MPRSLNAPLSPREEVALRHVASGGIRDNGLLRREVRRLKDLDLAEDASGQLKLTEFGHRRYATLPKMTAGVDPANSLPKALADLFAMARDEK